MKKLLLPLAMGIAIGSNAQVWSENFNSGMPSTWTMIKADNNVPSSALNATIVSKLTSQAWMIWPRGTADSAVLTTSYFSSPAKADRWLITPPFTVTDPNMVISWEDYAPDQSYADSMQILVSPTAGTSASSFTAVIYNDKGSPSFTKHGASLSAYNGQTIRVAFRNNSTDQYVLEMDNPKAEILTNAIDGSIASVEFPKMAPANSIVKVNLKNLGAQNITSATLTYSVDGGPAVTQTFNGLNLTPFGTTLLSFTTGVNAAQGPHSIVVNLTQTNGSADPVTTNNSATATFTIPGAPVSRNALIEEFTSSTCVPCAGFNATFDPLILANNANSGSDFNIIKYQMNWPSPGNDASYNSHGATRQAYYGVDAIPDHYTNGKPGGNGDQSEITSAKTAPSYLTMSGSYIIKGDSLIATVTLTPNFTLSNAGFKLRVAALEDHYTNNGATTSQKEYYHVMRTMLPDPNGTTVNTFTSGTPQTFTFKYKYTVGTVTQNSFLFWNHPFAGSIVAFVQDDATGDVLQSLSVRAAWPTDVKDIENGISQISLYPNPAMNNTTLVFGLEKATDVSVSIIDNLGRVVYSIPSQKTSAGTQQFNISTANLASGLYNLKIQTEAGSRIERLSVIK